MTPDGRYYGENDPEWAISTMPAHVAAHPVPGRQRAAALVLGGVVVTTGLVAGAFALGLTHDDAGPVATPLAPQADRTTVTPPTVTVTAPAPSATLAPRVTLAAVPRQTPQPRRTTATPPPVEVVAPPAAAPPAPPATEPPRPHRPPNQVGPNPPIITPIDPD